MSESLDNQFNKFVPHHFGDLYDENSDRAGEINDLATGKPINNSPAVSGADETLTTIDPGRSGTEDALGALPQENDAAAKWLRENGGDT